MLRFCPKCATDTERTAEGKCRPCRRAANAAWKVANKDRVRASNLKYYLADLGRARESRRRSSAKWRAANPEKIKDSQRRAYARKKIQRAVVREATRETREKERARRATAAKERAITRGAIWRANNRDKALAASKAWIAANPERVKAAQRRRGLRKAGWTEASFEAAWREQGGKCAICSRVMTYEWRSKDRVFADHDHATSKPRRLLCRNCNTGIGLFKDNPILLREAARYVEVHRA